MTSLPRSCVAILLLLVLYGFSANAPAPQEEDDWEDEVCEAIGCLNDTELLCGTAKGTRKIVIKIWVWEIVVDEEEYEIECTQGWS